MADDPYFQALFAERIGGVRYGKDTTIYKFEMIKRKKREALAAHPDVALLDFGIGENDDMAHARVRDAMKREVDDRANRGYADNGIQEYKDAAARFLDATFGVAINPHTEVVHTIGSKSALSMLPLVFINPGDVAIMTVPGYPVAGTHTRYLGGEVYPAPLEKRHGWLPRLDRIPDDVLARAKLAILNYPNSPTGAAAPASFWEEAVAWARAHRIVLVNDATHALLAYDGLRCFLQTPGARDVGIEAFSMSKGFNMIGWRLGFVAGNECIVRALADVKDHCDSGQFKAIQKAACVALDHAEIHAEIRAKSRRRLQKLVAALGAAGFDAAMPAGTYFLYVRAPAGADGVTFTTAQDAAFHLLARRLVLTVPWDDAGPYLRFSVTYEADGPPAEDALMRELAERLRASRLTFDGKAAQE